MGAQFSQFFPSRPTFTGENLPDQQGRVFLITGGTSGIGFELAKILYCHGGRVYITARNEEKAKKAIQEIQASAPNHYGELDFITLDLDDLTSIKASAEAFKAKESKLDILWNNAGVSQQPLGSVSKQGHEHQLAILLPLLDTTAASSASPGSVRVIWTSSQVAELTSPDEGIIMSELASPPKNNVRNYLNSKTGNLFLSADVALNPGAANTNLLKNARLMKILSYPLLHRADLAAHTKLYAGFSPEISLQNNGCYVVPFGRIHDQVADKLSSAMKVAEDGGTGRAKEFWEFCEARTRDYL
ncbi:uncharacterized protein BDW70DRAFT_154513 [Aspergillus foveolatus]|uniref:uncharacterized protein n=1 Tax=Aspergillus foveolatus TaxID=210207 RepID=UPI003CCCDC51